MANKRISELVSANTLTINDLLVVVNNAQTRKATVQDLIDFLIAQGEFAQLDNGTIPPAQLPALTTTIVAEGNKKYYTAARVLAELLVGLSVQNSAVASTDSLLSAIGKLQGQINVREEVAKKGVANGYAALDATGKVPAAQVPSGITNVLTGFATGANSTILSTDTILTALQKVQGQINAREEVAKKGAANGYASLDATGKVPAAQVPSSITNVLTGFATGTNSTILATDTILAALQKVQGQINAREEVAKKGAANGYAALDATGKVPAAQVPSSITNALTGFATGANSTILATDTILAAFQKVQGQINAREEVAKKGAVNGYASLDATGKVPVAQLPSGITDVLTGFAAGANTTVLATDTVLAGFQKVQGQINAREDVSKKGAANGYASLDNNARLYKAQLARGQRALDLDTSISSSTTTSETKVYSGSVNVGVLAAGDQVNVRAWFSAAANTNAKTVKLYINGSDTLSGATLVGTYTVPTGASSFKFERDISFLTATTAKAGAAPATSSRNGESAAVDTAFTIPNITNTFYFLIGATGATLSCDRVSLEALYWTAADPITG